MLWRFDFAKYFEDVEAPVQKLIDALTALLTKIFSFIADEEGWVEEETAG